MYHDHLVSGVVARFPSSSECVIIVDEVDTFDGDKFFIGHDVQGALTDAFIGQCCADDEGATCL
jgi:hypothetical protein